MRRFVLFDLLNVQALVEHSRFSQLDRESLEMLLEEAKRFSEQRLFPLNIEGDRTGAVYANGTVRATPGMRNAYGEFVQGGWLTMSEESDLGGQGLPEVDQVCCARTVPRGELSVHVLREPHARRGEAHRTVRHG